jgi:4'-phosphopantetheinyl transferase
MPNTFMATNPICLAEVSRVLASDEVHVWRIPVEANAAAAHDFSQLLSPAEQARANRYTRDEDRCRFQIARAATRCILGRYLGLPPAKLGIELDRLGKPRLNAATVPIDRRVHFNLSHSGSWILAAFAQSFAVGIDVEPVRAEAVTGELIEYFMSDSERRILHRLPKDQQIAAFFKCWTSKEALLKGLGVGLTVALRGIEVSIDPDQPAQLITAPPELCSSDWHLRSLAFSAPYAATLAVAAKSAQIVDITVDSWPNIND